MLKLFLDTEFTGLHQNSTLISLAIVAESGEEFYAEFTDYDQRQIDNWVNENVIIKLGIDKISLHDNLTYIKGTCNEVALAITNWLTQFPIEYTIDNNVMTNIQIWADCYAWDWILFTNLYGNAFQIPKQIHYMTMDLATYIYSKGYPVDISRKILYEKLYNKGIYIDPDGLSEHHALYDARLELACFKKLF